MWFPDFERKLAKLKKENRFLLFIQCCQLLAIIFIVVMVCRVSKARTPSPDIKAVALAAANTYDINYNLIMAIIKVESNFNQYAVGSSCGEVGLMQLRPDFFPSVSFDIAQNIFMGAAYLAELKQRYTSEYGSAWFIAYNVGNVHIQNPTQYPYYLKVERAMDQLSRSHS